jgi:uncharacterized membrane protein
MSTPAREKAVSTPATSGGGNPHDGAGRATPASARQRRAAPPWVRWSTLALSLAGLGVSLYLTIAHYTTPATLACPETGIVNCAKVTTSPQSILFGVIPLAVLGLGFFLFLTAVNSPWAWRSGWPAVRWARLGALIAGVAFVLYLIYTELFTLDAICLWCTSIHVITILLFALVVPTATAPARAGQNLTDQPQ